MKKYKAISDYLYVLNKQFGFQICINDLVGFLNSDHELYVALQPYLIHKNPFCMQIKSNQTLWEQCLQKKENIYHKCNKIKGSYYGHCYCGIGEYIVPIFSDDLVIGFICVGEYALNLEDAETIISNISQLHHMEFNTLMDKYIKSTSSEIPSIELVTSLLNIVAEHITAIYSTSTCKQLPLSLNKKHFFCMDTYTLTHAIEYIKQNYSKDITLQDIAEFCHCSISYLSRTFNQKMNTSINSYLNQIRIEQAKQLLSQSTLPVSHIATTIGFNDPNYFSSVFKEKCGVTPREYRKYSCK